MSLGSIPDGNYIATITPKDGVFPSDGAYLLNVEVDSTKKETSTQKLANFGEDLGKYLGYFLKVFVAVSIVMKIFLDLIFRDRESQGFFIWLIIAVKMMTRVRYLDTYFGFATTAFFDSIGEPSFSFKMYKNDISEDSHGISPKFYKYRTSVIPLLSMPVLSWLYPIFFVLKRVISAWTPVDKTWSGNGTGRSVTRALMTYYFYKIYFLVFMISAIDITFFGVRALAHIHVVDTTFRGVVSFLHALCLVWLVFIDICIVIGTILSLPTSSANRWIWTGCYYFSEEYNDPLQEDANSQIEVVEGDNVSEVTSPKKQLQPDSLHLVWRDLIGALFVLAETPNSRRKNVLAFSRPSRYEAIFTFLRPFLFNLLIVALNNNILPAVILLVVIELLRMLLLTMKGCQENRINFYERIRLFMGIFESFCFLVFYAMTLYCYFLEDDTSAVEPIPYNVQFCSIFAVVFLLITSLI